MADKLTLNKRIDNAISNYYEEYVGDYLYFEGRLLPRYEGAKDLEIIRFINGGIRYKDYRLEREGPYIRGWVKYYSYEPSIPVPSTVGKRKSNNGKERLNDDIVRQIDELYAKGLFQMQIAAKFGVSQWTISQVVNRKGAYKEVDNDRL